MITKYRIDFIGEKESEKDFSSILVYFETDKNKKVLGVYDGGFESTGRVLLEHLEKHYFNYFKDGKRKLDFIVCSHPHDDHVSGLKYLIENCEVQNLYMNRPWKYADELFKYRTDGRITQESLERQLKEIFSSVDDLEAIAAEKSVNIVDAFAGAKIEDEIYVLSPSIDFYKKLIIECCEKLETKINIKESSEGLFSRVKKYILNIIEEWNKETLKEDVSTSPENEMSIVLYCNAGNESFLLTGDSGLRGLGNAIEKAGKKGISIKDSVSFYQIPHHGSRHNVSPSLLNELLGEIKDDSHISTKIAVASVCKDSDHPLKVVTNAFIRRSVKIYSTKDGNIISYSYKLPSYDGWTFLKEGEFSNKVEKWN
ncbi:MAG: MBL fold metallo-hydrolase [Treponemataceae bacterium]|nr:MBL fold metallo-hydrolase [Treponemataceae bacterium]